MSNFKKGDGVMISYMEFDHGDGDVAVATDVAGTFVRKSKWVGFSVVEIPGDGKYYVLTENIHPL